MPFHRPILVSSIVLTTHQTHRSHRMEHRNVATIISIHPNKFSAMNLFTKPTKRMFKPRQVYVAKCKLKSRVLSLPEQWSECFLRICFVIFMGRERHKMIFVLSNESFTQSNELLSMISIFIWFFSELLTIEICSAFFHTEMILSFEFYSSSKHQIRGERKHSSSDLLQQFDMHKRHKHIQHVTYLEQTNVFS